MSNVFLKQEDFERIFKSHIKIETYTKSIESLYSLRSANRIDYKPYYQRNYVWDDHKATYFIESILLGTEIPPLIFFNNGQNTEVIDGRQRFETIKRFKSGEFQLTKKGLTTLLQLTKSTYDSLRSTTPEIIDLFLDAKLRIIEFQIVNEPKLNPDLEDKVKKEIFSRYNSGITPLKKPEIDNAIYDEDILTKKFKQILKRDIDLKKNINEIFLPQRSEIKKDISIESILQFIRKHLVFAKFPIYHYASGAERTEIFTKLYEYFSDNITDVDEICNLFIKKVKIVKSMRDEFIAQGLNYNRLVFECLMWGVVILDNEDYDLTQLEQKETLKYIAEEISNNLDKFTTEDSHHYKQTIERYSFIASLLTQITDLNLQIYIGGNSVIKEHIKYVKQINDNQTNTKLNELETLRITKPDPSRNSIDDIARIMDRSRFLVRPSYQRSEVIDLSKASAIIESILLGIHLPPIFVYKRENGVQEVIDGQQRLLTILGFIGKEYIDEDGLRRATKNQRFKLRKLKIMKELNEKTFDELEQFQKDMILDFELFVVEIEEKLNPQFNPVDLFIRLNDKPYPIKEHSFEMWNSWVDRDVIKKLKEKTNKYKSWFYVAPLKQRSDRDRMLNEELFTALAYLNYKKQMGNEVQTYLDVYQKTDRTNSRIREKKDITHILMEISENMNTKNTFVESIKQVENFINKLKIILIDRDIDIDKDKVDIFLEAELNSFFKAKKQKLYFTRRMQDFYLLWLMINDINLEMIKAHRQQIKQDIANLFVHFKNIPLGSQENSIEIINQFKEKYSRDNRGIKLTDEQKLQLIRQQGNRDPISGDLIFLGDDIEVDHIKPLAIGGADQLENLQVVHKDNNRKKGAKFSIKLKTK